MCVVLILSVALVACGGEGADTGRVIRIPLGAGGVGFLPLHIMRARGLIEDQAAAMGLNDVSVEWIELGGPSVMNDALLSGSVDFIAAGPPAFLTLWDRTRGSLDVRGVAAMSALPMYLNVRNNAFADLESIGDTDKIALTAIKVSIPAIIMQMYAAERFGPDQAERFDRFTVSMTHPDGVVAMLSGSGDISAHFTSPPFHQRETADPAITTVMTSDDVMGGTTTFTMLSTTAAYHDANADLVEAVIRALEVAQQSIAEDSTFAAETLIDAEGNAGLSADEIVGLLADPNIRFSTTPANLMRYAEFMNSIGSLREAPATWRDLFFEEIHDLPGG